MEKSPGGPGFALRGWAAADQTPVVSHSTDICVRGARLYLLPVPTRVPLKFGTETLSHVTCLRVRLSVVNRIGKTAVGWGETPLSVQWGWPSPQPYDERLRAMVALAHRIAEEWVRWGETGHALELGWDFVEGVLPRLWKALNAERAGDPMPWLAALITASAFDLALHDALGVAAGRPVYELYGREHLSRDLAYYLRPAEGSSACFAGKYPGDFLAPRRNPMRAWHLVGGVDPVDRSELRGDEPSDGYPVLLEDWVERDGLKCLKIKLRGNDAGWDYQRLVAVGRLAIRTGVDWLTADFNCTVREATYVDEILDRLCADEPRIYGMLLYVEQPFAYDLEANPLDVRSVSARKPLFLDESAHDWRLIRLGRSLGWTGVALKTCKTQSGALLSLCWARAHGMTLMVQDLTNPMLAQIPHLLLAAYSPTIMGVESNSMQFYPDASAPEAMVHPGCFRRRSGVLDLSTVGGPGFGYRLTEIRRELPTAELVLEQEKNSDPG
ncbi:MAG: mandelate racemase/muconate lactonizing enzyme family protein [Verrucomicrobiales bacterium]|nr:mandelate racemase/muconate lactonizing enzyme family protein [Verrucomicrobiales bacterium]